jgi:DNA-binding NtrC family response regulator
VAAGEALKTMRILTIDDDQWIRNSLTYYFRKKTAAFVALETAEEALELLQRETFDIVLCDYQLPGIDGLMLLRRLQQQQPQARTVLITAYGTDDVLAEAQALGVEEIIQKPFTTKTIEACFERMIAG